VDAITPAGQPEQAIPGGRSDRDPTPVGECVMGPTGADRNTRLVAAFLGEFDRCVANPNGALTPRQYFEHTVALLLRMLDRR
jgi:hypothetical protein